jgi:hypothetical protein
MRCNKRKKRDSQQRSQKDRKLNRSDLSQERVWSWADTVRLSILVAHTVQSLSSGNLTGWILVPRAKPRASQVYECV